MTSSAVRRRRKANTDLSSPTAEADIDHLSGRQTGLSSPAYSGWPVDLTEIFWSIWEIISLGYIQVYYTIFELGDTMALGFLRLFGSAGTGSGSGENDSENEVELENKVNVKRRRRRDDRGSQVDKGYYPGMVNLSGTLCYMNSVLQAFASIPALVTHMERIIALAVEFDVPTPIADALLDVLQDLNTPHTRPRRPIRPTNLLAALRTLPSVQRLLGTREQQDAHELFLVLAEAVSVESLKVAGEVSRSRGLGEVLSLDGWAAGKMGAKKGLVLGSKETDKRMEAKRAKAKRQRGLAQPWEGLMARRRVCRVCGWCEAVRMESVGGMELSLPQYGDVSLDACIAQYLAPESLSDVTCEMCSLHRTYEYYTAEIERLSKPGQPSKEKAVRPGSGSFGAIEDLKSTSTHTNGLSAPGEMTPARKKRAKEAKKVQVRLQEMITSGTPSHFGESSLPAPSGSNPLPIKWQTSRTDSIRAALITRPPQTLRLHLIRSEYTPYGTLLKKSARVGFPVILDLTRFVTRGIWDERTGVLGALSTGEGKEGRTGGKRTLYRLESVILHYGYNHSSGHYVCIRRKPRPTPHPSSSASTAGPTPSKPKGTTKTCPDGCTCESCAYFGQVRNPPGEESTPGKGWLRVSDDEVEEVGEEALIESRSQVFMLFYEKVGEYVGDQSGGVPGESTENQGERRMDGSGSEGRKTPESINGSKSWGSEGE